MRYFALQSDMPSACFVGFISYRIRAKRVYIANKRSEVYIAFALANISQKLFCIYIKGENYEKVFKQ